MQRHQTITQEIYINVCGLWGGNIVRDRVGLMKLATLPSVDIFVILSTRAEEPRGTWLPMFVF